jgi:hypothetical protein
MTQAECLGKQRQAKRQLSDQQQQQQLRDKLVASQQQVAQLERRLQ